MRESLKPEGWWRCATHDVGLGTAYERWAVYRRIADWCAGDVPGTALEGPVDGMAGMTGLHLLPLARRGTRVTVALPDAGAAQRVRTIYERAGLASQLEIAVSTQPPAGPFDLVLSFNALPLVHDWRGYLERQLRATRSRLLLVVTNRDSYGARLRRAARVFESRPVLRPRLFEHESTDPGLLRSHLERHGEIVEEDFLDCPWWPDLFVPTGSTLWGGTVGRLLPRPKRRAPFTYDEKTFPYIKEEPPPELARQLRRHPVFDERPPRLGQAFGHHRAYLVRKRD